MPIAPKPLIFLIPEVQFYSEYLTHIDLQLEYLPMHILHSFHLIIAKDIRGWEEYTFNGMMKHSAK